MVLAAVSGQGNPGDAYDHVKEAYLPAGVRWLEVGFFTISASKWTTVQTTYRNFKDPVVFLSLPNLAGETSDDGQPMSLRIRNTELTVVDEFISYFQFEAISYNVNSSFCTTINFYTPADLDIPDSNIGWLVVEKGKFNVTNKGFIIQTDTLNRTSRDVDETVNHFRSFAQSGICDGGQDCEMTGVPEDELLTIAQLQSHRFARFLLLRGVELNRRYVVYILQTADSGDDAGFVVPDPGEDYAWMLFQSGMETHCIEDLLIESYQYRVSNMKLDVTYVNTFALPPALFGMVNTLIGGDSVGLRAFNLDVNTANFITQEDKCEKDETDHVNPETTGVLVVGRAAGVGTTVCAATFNWEPPASEFCVEVTLYDTFGDGWGDNVALRVWSDSPAFNESYIYYDCDNNGTFTETVCYPNFLDIYFDIHTFEPPATETWEMFWTLRTLGETGYIFDANGDLFQSELFLGDYDTNMTVYNADVEVFNPVELENVTCSVCKHPPPKPKAGSKSKPHSHSSSEESTTASDSASESAGKSGPKDRALRHSESNNSTRGRSYTESTYSESSNSTEGETGDESTGKGKSKPKPPHWPFPVTLFDVEGNGWFNGSDAWVKVPKYNCDDSVLFDDFRRLPELVTNPEYVISTFDRVNILRRNTICGDLLKEDCEERLPDGKYIFRVGGALSNDNTANNSFWKFCGVEGAVMEELEFKLVKGKCVAGKRVSALDLCCGSTTSTAMFTGSFVLSNVAGAGLTEYDTNLLESILAESFSVVQGGLHSSVSLTSWEFVGSSLTVEFRLAIDPAALQLRATDYAVFEGLTTNLFSSAEAFVASGSFLAKLQTGLLDLSSADSDVLAATAAITMVSLEYSTVNHVPNVASEATLQAAQKEQTGTLSASPSASGSHAMLSSFEQTIVAVVAAVVGVGFVATLYGIVTRSQATTDSDSMSGKPLIMDNSMGHGSHSISGTNGFAVEMVAERVPDFN